MKGDEVKSGPVPGSQTAPEGPESGVESQRLRAGCRKGFQTDVSKKYHPALVGLNPSRSSSVLRPSVRE